MTIRIASDRFAGTSPTYPDPGDLVEIVEGEDIGVRLEVLRISGYAFNPVYRVYVRRLDGEEVWYWPWNIKIIDK